MVHSDPRLLGRTQYSPIIPMNHFQQQAECGTCHNKPRLRSQDVGRAMMHPLRETVCGYDGYELDASFGGFNMLQPIPKSPAMGIIPVLRLDNPGWQKDDQGQCLKAPNRTGANNVGLEAPRKGGRIGAVLPCFMVQLPDDAFFVAEELLQPCHPWTFFSLVKESLEPALLDGARCLTCCPRPSGQPSQSKYQSEYGFVWK